MPVALAGLCSGASGDELADRGQHLVVDHDGRGEARRRRARRGAPRATERRRRRPARRARRAQRRRVVGRRRSVADPLDVPDASAPPASPSTSRYFSDDEPQLRTKTGGITRCCAWMAVMATVLTMSCDGRAAREVVDRLAQPLQHRADGHRAGAALHRLVGVVAGVEVGEDEDRRAPGDRAARQLRRAPRPRRPPRRTGSAPRPTARGARSRTSSVAARTRSTSAPPPESPVE